MDATLLNVHMLPGRLLTNLMKAAELSLDGLSSGRKFGFRPRMKYLKVFHASLEYDIAYSPQRRIPWQDRTPDTGHFGCSESSMICLAALWIDNRNWCRIKMCTHWVNSSPHDCAGECDAADCDPPRAHSQPHQCRPARCHPWQDWTTQFAPYARDSRPSVAAVGNS